MNEYKEMYYKLFNEVSKVIEQLQEIQQKTEEMYMNADSEESEE